MLEGRTCFITGGAQGIGLGIALACAERGAALAVADVNAEALEAAEARLEGLTQVRSYVLDVSDRAAVADVARRVEAELPPVRALFNNAGIADSVSPSRMRGEVWDWVVGVNLHGVYNGIQAFLPGMLERGEGGWITNTSSIAGLISGGSGFAYSASKHAVVGLSTSLRLELAQRDISVSVVCPGQVATSIMSNTQDLRPGDAEPHTERTKQILAAANESLLQAGVSADEAGRTIVAATLAGLPFIFTDDLWGPMLEQQHQTILDSMAGCFPTKEVHA